MPGAKLPHFNSSPSTILSIPVPLEGGGLFGDDITGVDFTATVCGTEFSDSVLAVTLTAGTCLNQQCTGGFHITDADIVFNNNENWDVYTGPSHFLLLTLSESPYMN